MKVVSTGHGDNSGRGGEEVVATNRAVVLHGAWMAFVRSGARDGNANIAFLAMGEVLAQTFASSADSAVWTVVNLLLAVVVP
jgi:hypothetical protein